MNERRPLSQAERGCRGEEGMRDTAASADMEQSRDLLCGMTAQLGKDTALDYQSRHYVFCSAKCKTKFVLEPERYLQEAMPEPAQPGPLYTCLMHPVNE